MAVFCSNCGTKLEKNDKYCPKCGKKEKEDNSANYNNVEYNTNVKTKISAGLLGIFLGYLGIHNFYLGYNNKAISQLLLTLIGSWFCGIGAIVSGIWGLVEGIQILTGSINTDANGNQLRD